MQITLQLSDEICREAESRKLPVIDFVETLIEKGLAALRNNGSAATDDGSFSTAIERIRALHSTAPDSKH
jgi:hypothetical protein